MSLQIEKDPTPLTLDANGNVRVAGTRITLDNIIWLYKQGYAADAIAEAYPAVPLAAIYDVIAYYLRHTKSVEAYLNDRQAHGEGQREQHEREFGAGPTKAELLARSARRHGGTANASSTDR
jgi:uncharacterized protein (DUF433 family)